MAIHFPSTTFRPRTIAVEHRRAIKSQIESLIALLDQFDGDPDLEDDELHDDALDLGEAAMIGCRPVYGIDQTRGPL